jgi:glycosyltransferase involved in cell wall biosynthesis
VVIVDDCSSDNTFDLLNSFIFPPGLVIIERNAENRGQSWCRNLAVSISNSDFIIVFDDDDFSLPERSVEHKRMFDLGTHMNFVSSKKIYPSGRIVSLLNSDAFLKSVSGEDALLAVLSGEAIQDFSALAIPASTSAYSREFFKSVNGYDPEFRRLEDAELFVRFSNRNASFAWSSKECVHRTATFSPNKGGSTEMLYEIKLLEKHREDYPEIQVRRIRALIEMRAMYFDREFFRLIVDVLFNSEKRRIFISKFKSALLRIKHDLKTGLRR